MNGVSLCYSILVQERLGFLDGDKGSGDAGGERTHKNGMTGYNPAFSNFDVYTHMTEFLQEKLGVNIRELTSEQVDQVFPQYDPELQSDFTAWVFEKQLRAGQEAGKHNVSSDGSAVTPGKESNASSGAEGEGEKIDPSEERDHPRPRPFAVADLVQRLRRHRTRALSSLKNRSRNPSGRNRWYSDESTYLRHKLSPAAKALLRDFNDVDTLLYRFGTEQFEAQAAQAATAAQAAGTAPSTTLLLPDRSWQQHFESGSMRRHATRFMSPGLRCLLTLRASQCMEFLKMAWDNRGEVILEKGAVEHAIKSRYPGFADYLVE